MKLGDLVIHRHAKYSSESPYRPRLVLEIKEEWSGSVARWFRLDGRLDWYAAKDYEVVSESR